VPKPTVYKYKTLPLLLQTEILPECHSHVLCSLPHTTLCINLKALLLIRDLRSFEIRFKFESAVPIRFESDGLIRKFSNRPCLPIARRSQTTQTINGA